MKFYEEQRYDQWKDHVDQVLPSLLKKNLIIKPTQAQQQQLQQLQQQQAAEEGQDDPGNLIIRSAEIKCKGVQLSMAPKFWAWPFSFERYSYYYNVKFQFLVDMGSRKKWLVYIPGQDGSNDSSHHMFPLRMKPSNQLWFGLFGNSAICYYLSRFSFSVS